MTRYAITEIPPLGYGTPDAKISLTKKLESGELYEPAVIRGAEIIQSGECMVDITEPDDGCIDGRLAMHLVYPSEEVEGDFKEVSITNPEDHTRKKVAGGGYVTALTMKLALDPEIEHVHADLEGVADHLTSLGVYCGAHTGSHGRHGSVDCGANDKYDVILPYQHHTASQINETVKALWPLCSEGVAYSEDIEKISNEGVARTLSHEGYFDGSTGESRFDVIMNNIAKAQKKVGGTKPVAVSKHLGGEHNEGFVVAVAVKGKTFSQAAFKRKLKEEFPDIPEEKLPEAFVVDLLRVTELAEAMAKGRPDEKEAFSVGLHAGLGYQFATAGTLTDGTLRTWVIAEKPELQEAA